ncbi:MAG: hypothetical protein V5A28_11125 [Haloarculaceae archaeon]
MATDATALALAGSESPPCAYPFALDGTAVNRSAGIGHRFESTVAA